MSQALPHAVSGTVTEQAIPQNRILIVDDVDENLMISSAILKKAGYAIHTAKSGADCIQMAHEIKPHLILLDINMPGMNGLEACEVLKKDPATDSIPVIFLTAISDSSHIVRAFQVGGVDYIVKPFRAQELLARVNVHIALQNAQTILRKQNEHLEQLNKEKSEFLGIAAHDLKNPLSGIIGLAELLVTRQETQISEKDVSDMSQQIKHSAQFMFEIVANLLDVNKIEEGNITLAPKMLDVYAMSMMLIDRYELAAERKSLTFVKPVAPPALSPIYADELATAQVLDNLISNAVKYSPQGKTIHVVMEAADEGFVRVSVRDEGQGLTEDDKTKLFQKFSKLSARPTADEHSTGLGLSIAKKLIDLMNARVSVESEEGKGATFIVDFPTQAPAAA